MKKLLLGAALLAVLTCNSSAAILGLAGGTVPPSTYNPLFGWPMTPFNSDGRPSFGFSVNDVPSPIAGVVTFSLPLEHYITPAEWATWSNGYAGDVYLAAQGAVTLGMPAGTNAFYLYAEPNSGVYNITATALGGAVLTQTVNSSGGASYYGFWCTAGDTISSIAMTGAGDFAVGEFGINQETTGSIVIDKSVFSPNGIPWDTQDWEFTVTGDDMAPLIIQIAAGGGTQTIPDLPFGEYTVTETPVEWWQTDVSSSDPNATFGPGAVTLLVSPGGSVTANFANTLIPEPCSLTLLGLGLLAVARRRRRS